MIFEQEIYKKWQSALSSYAGDQVRIGNVGVVGGGSINEARRITTSHGLFFAKMNKAADYPAMFEKEASGLRFLEKYSPFEIPKPIGVGVDDDTQWILMEFINAGERRDDYWEVFGRRMAEMHAREADFFGLDHDNYIGSLTQANSPCEHWLDFFASRRLEPQLKVAIDQGLLHPEMSRHFDKLFSRLGDFFPEEPPAPLHGDLWTGNFRTTAQGEATIFDPAVYFGHRYMDLGMSRLFGGFDPAFYKVYHETYPLEDGWEEGAMIANLYPLMVHVNLFGTGYAAQVLQTLRELV